MSLIDLFYDWLNNDTINFLAGVFVGFFLTIIGLLIYDHIEERRRRSKKQ